MSFIRVIRFFLLFVTLLVSSAFQKSPDREQEYILKAAFIYRFSDYVDWGERLTSETFNIAVLGSSDIVSPLRDISKNKEAKNRRIIVKEYKNLEDIRDCQVVFISRNYSRSIEALELKNNLRSALFITESRSDFEKGSHINFIVAESKLRFEVNLKTTAKSGLKISSQLLQHALTIKND